MSKGRQDVEGEEVWAKCEPSPALEPGGGPPGPGLSCCLCSPSREAAVQGLACPCCLAGGEVVMAGAGLCAIMSLSKDCES